MIALLRRIPAWAWYLLGYLAFAACEDVRHQRCAVGGGKVIKGVVLDGCDERPAK